MNRLMCILGSTSLFCALLYWTAGSIHAAPTDADGDGVPTKTDCDDANPAVGRRLFQDGFNVANTAWTPYAGEWSLDGQGYYLGTGEPAVSLVDIDLPQAYVVETIQAMEHLDAYDFGTAGIYFGFDPEIGLGGDEWNFFLIDPDTAFMNFPTGGITLCTDCAGISKAYQFETGQYYTLSVEVRPSSVRASVNGQLIFDLVPTEPVVAALSGIGGISELTADSFRACELLGDTVRAPSSTAAQYRFWSPDQIQAALLP
ncbi:MAG: hypothetical protein HYV32_02885 [Candidatus Kerfeldbacteria bacterium]|nr:hypothetical protein [Candidatus Kerfeldbacteria bacterium]